MDVMYPYVTVSLIGVGSSSLSIIRAVAEAMRTSDISPKYVNAFIEEALSSNNENILNTCQKYVIIR